MTKKIFLILRCVIDTDVFNIYINDTEHCHISHKLANIYLKKKIIIDNQTNNLILSLQPKNLCCLRWKKTSNTLKPSYNISKLKSMIENLFNKTIS